MTMRGDIPETLKKLAVPIESLVLYPGNARKHNYDVIRESMSMHGQYRPVVVRSGSNEVLAGNGTVEVAKEFGWTHVAATFVDVDDDTARRIVLVDNRSNDLAAYDDNALVQLLQGLEEDFDGTGYDADDLAKLLEDVDAAGAPGSADLLDEPDEDNYASQYAVMVTCRDETHQEEVFDALTALGYTVKPVSV